MTMRSRDSATPMQHAVVVAVTLVVLLSLTTTAATAAAAAKCPALRVKTLSFDCAARCPASDQSCLTFNANERDSPCYFEDVSKQTTCVSSSSESCDVVCFAPHQNGSDTFKFYVAFNRTRIPKPISSAAGETDTEPVLEEVSDGVAYETNAYVRRIGQLHLPPRITQVVIAGSRTAMGTRGSVVDVEIDREIFSGSDQVTSVSLLNMDLGSRAPDVAAWLPSGVLSLDLSNTNLTAAPPSLQQLTQLESLTIDKNQLDEFPTSLNLPSLRTLRLRENSLSAFATVMTSMELLDLSLNTLVGFPYNVLELTNLHTLLVDRNPTMAKVVFSQDQFTKLASMEVFSIDTAVLDATSCSSNQIQQLPRNTSASVCVVTELEWNVYQENLRSGSSRRGESTIAPSSTTPTTAPSSTTPTAAIVVTAVLLGAATFASVFYWRIRRTHNLKTLESTGRTDDATDRDMESGDIHFEKIARSAPKTTNGVAAKRQPDQQLSDGSSTGRSPKVRYTLHTDVSLVSYRMKVDKIEDVHVIGSGGFAIVWLVQYLPQNRLLASKRLIKDQVTRQKTMDFVMEIKLNMQLDHPNIVQLVGVAWTIETDLQALLEYLPNGDLRSHLETTAPTASSPPPPWDAQKLQLAIDIVEALVYVHSFSPPLVHRDLKSRNVLLTDAMKAKLCDFGVSRFASENNTMTTAVGTGKWLAPEVVAGSNSYNESCDIYSFGVVMSELDTHRLPYDDVMGPQGHRLPEVAVLQMVSSGQIQPTLSAACPDEIRRVILQCLTFMPAERPTAMEVAYALRLVARTFNGLM